MLSPLDGRSVVALVILTTTLSEPKRPARNRPNPAKREDRGLTCKGNSLRVDPGLSIGIWLAQMAYLVQQLRLLGLVRSMIPNLTGSAERSHPETFGKTSA